MVVASCALCSRGGGVLPSRFVVWWCGSLFDDSDGAWRDCRKEEEGDPLLVSNHNYVKHNHNYVLNFYDEISEQGVEFDRLCANLYEVSHLANSRVKYDFFMR